MVFVLHVHVYTSPSEKMFLGREIIISLLFRLLPTYYIANILALLCRCVFGHLNLSDVKINLNTLEPN